jgi:hypothetical protein
MNGLILPAVVVENTANPGQLKSITDTVPYFKCGQVAFGPNYATEGDLYMYVKNGVGSAVTAGVAYAASPYYLATSGVDYDMQLATLSDEGAGQVLYVAVPQVAIPSLYYGWVKYKGDVTTLTGSLACATETRVVGDMLGLSNSAPTVTAVSGYTSGIYCSAFAIVTTANTVSSATVSACRLLGRETLQIA